MKTSLRSRLVLTYVLLILVVLFIVAVGLLVYFLRNPVLYRQEVFQVRYAGRLIANQIQTNTVTNPVELENLAARVSETLHVRVVIYAADGQVTLDMPGGQAAPLPPPGNPRKRLLTDQPVVRVVKDGAGAVWLTVGQLLAGESSLNGYTLVTAVKRPRLALRTILRDELIAPLLHAAFVALILALIMAWLMAQSISAPLKSMTEGARQVAKGNYQPIPVEGPAEVQALAAAFNDMTGKVKASQTSQREFIADVSHELKTPLTSIKGFAQAILDGTAETPQSIQQAAQVIFNESERMFRLVMDLLTLARYEGGIAEIQTSSVDLNLLVQGLLNQLTPQAAAAQVSISYQPVVLPTITGDFDKLSQVFANLLDNAIKFTPPEGTITIQAHTSTQWVEVSIHDSGPGIAQSDRTRIFDRFYQSDRSRKGGTGRGVGLGLSIAKQIILAHHGQIEVESPPGSGAVFIVRLPIITNQAAPAP